jgi:hypothetical protein
MLRTCGLSGAALVLLMAAAAVAQTPPESGTLRIGGGEIRVTGPIGGNFVYEVTGNSAQSTYYLGIECLPVMPALRAQLNLPERQGVLVAAVLPGSPAAAASIAQHDLLMRIAGKPLDNPQTLLDAVEAAKGGKLKIELIRGGKPRTIEVAPAKRPSPLATTVPARAEAEPADWETVQKWLEGNKTRAPQGERPQSMTFTITGGPGLIVPPDVLVQRPLPANMSIVVSKVGDQPAKIQVQRDGKEWKVTEKELDKLPADIRPHVDQMLGRPRGLVGRVQAFNLPAPPPGVFPGMPGMAAPAQPMLEQRAPLGPIEQRLEEMSRRLDQLLKMVEKMADEPAHKKPPK